MPSKTAPHKKERERFSFSWSSTLASFVILAVILCIAAGIALLPSSPLHIEIKDTTPPPVSLDALSWDTSRPDAPDPNLAVGDLPPNVYSKEYVRPPKGSFTFRINRTPYLSDGVLQELYAQNCSLNPFDMTVTILLEDGTVLYRSGLISENQYLPSVPCEVILEKPAVSAAAIIQVYDRESTQEPLKTFTEQLTITTKQK